jgi:release factor glutamine methyltransferase
MPRSPVAAEVVTRLRAAGCVFAEDEAALLHAEASDTADLERMVTLRVTGVPLEQVVGWAELCGRRVVVTPGVFVPRQRTALLVRRAEALLRPGSVLVDLGCGSGAIAAVLLAAIPGLEVYAADIDATAVDCTRRNLPPERVFLGDLYQALPSQLRGAVDVIAANAPYVPTAEIALMPPEARDHEHRVALDGGTDGLDVQRTVIAGAPEWLAPGGHLLVETGRSQVDATSAAMAAAGLQLEVATDDAGGTVVIGRLGTPLR